MSYTGKSKELAFLLRHDRDYDWDAVGWRSVSDLVSNHGFSAAMLDEIVAKDNKGRYEFNEDKTFIRALQGHSIPVDPGFEEKLPPQVLYHGTATRFVDSIRETGVQKMTRNMVQMSDNVDTAKSVGSRHGVPYILEIDTVKMVEDGIKFYQSKNNVWLTSYIDPKYIKNFINKTDI